MKNLFLGAIILFFLGCQETAENKSQEAQYFDKNVGHPISNETGIRWIANFEKKRKWARVEGQVFQISQSNLQKMLGTSTTEIVQLTFHHAIDDNGQYHIIVVPLENNMPLWGESSKVLVDANTNQQVSINTTKKWTTNYKLLNPNEVQYHLFGVNIFSEIIKSQKFDIEPALSDDGVPQMLLIVRNNSGQGRRQDGDVTYDGGNRCPPICPH